MSLQALTYVVVGLSFTLYIGIAIWSRAQSTGDFYIAGRSVSPLANGMATAADWMSAASFISMAGLIAFLGYDGSVYLMGWTGGYVLLALLLAPYLRKFGKFTVPEFIGERYYSRTARVVAVICLIFISFTYVAGQMRGVGIVFSRFLEVDVTVGLVVGMGIVFVYAVLGGMKGVTYTQVAQYCVLIFAYTVPAIFIAIQLTGNPIPQLAFGSEVADSGTALLDKLDDIVTSLGFNQYTSGTKSKIDIFCITMALMAGTAGLPHVIVRFFTVPRVKDARISAGYALLFIAILYTTAPAVGSMARYNLINTMQPGEIGAVDGNLAYEDRPDWFETWQRTGLLTYEDRNGDGRIQYYDDSNPDFAAMASYVGNVGTRLVYTGNGIFYGNSSVRVRDISDGTANTFLAGERAQLPGRDAAWVGIHWDQIITFSGGEGGGGAGPTTRQTTVGRHVLGSTQSRPNTGSGGFSSMHVGGFHMLLCDGSVHFISESINRSIYSRLGNRKDGQTVGAF
ncbi:MAG: VC_2705 family sodium/solute symporter [Proteobacteria bacterium]|nr:VC_2705 family sodium/solute symporter [Pseudomonadota bacterium]